MAKDDDLFRQVMEDVTETLTANLREVLSTTLEKQLTESLTKSLLESEFYRRISTDMRSGLRRIYKEMSEARNAAAPGSEPDIMDAAAEKAAADKLFHDASEQLSAVLRQTEDAANTIMGVVEKHTGRPSRRNCWKRPAWGASRPPNGSASTKSTRCWETIWSL